MHDGYGSPRQVTGDDWIWLFSAGFLVGSRHHRCFFQGCACEWGGRQLPILPFESTGIVYVHGIESEGWDLSKNRWSISAGGVWGLGAKKNKNRSVLLKKRIQPNNSPITSTEPKPNILDSQAGTCTETGRTCKLHSLKTRGMGLLKL